MPASASSARKARRSNGAGDDQGKRQNYAAEGARARLAAARGGRAQALVRVPLLEAHLRAGDRRRCGHHGGGGVFAGKDDARGIEDRRQRRRRQGGRQADRRARPGEGRQRGDLRSRQLSLSRPRQGARRCGARKRLELLTTGRIGQASWHVNPASEETKSATANSSTSSSPSIASPKS